MPGTETGWTKHWPKAGDTFYWMRYCDGRYRDLPVHVDGIHVMCLFDHSYSQRGNIEGEVEFLGPISPSDFQQIEKLREAAQATLTFMQSTHIENSGAVQDQLREALYQPELAQRKEVKP